MSYFLGFIKMFSNVAHLTLDLSNNKLERLPTDVLYENASNWENKGTQILKGKMVYLSFSCNKSVCLFSDQN